LPVKQALLTEVAQFSEATGAGLGLGLGFTGPEDVPETAIVKAGFIEVVHDPLAPVAVILLPATTALKEGETLVEEPT
jgi:hypothetical protein